MAGLEVLEDITTESSKDNNDSVSETSVPPGAGSVDGALDPIKELAPGDFDDQENNGVQRAGIFSSSHADQNCQSSSPLAGSETEQNVLRPDEVSLPKVKALRITEKPKASTSPKYVKSGTAGSPTGALSPNRSKSADFSRVVVDTAAPIESVKDAVSKFGGIVDWKTHKVQTLERCRYIDQEIEKTHEEMSDCRKMSQAAEDAKMEVLAELEWTKKQIDELELQLSLRSPQIEEHRETSEPNEVHQVTVDESDAAAEQEFQAIISQHEAALAELKSLKEELEVEKKVKQLTAELVASKESLDASQADYREAEELRKASAVACEQENLRWEREVKQVEAEVERLNQEYLSAEDLKRKLDSDTALLSTLKTEMACYIKSKTGQGNDDAHLEAENSMIELQLNKKELETVKLRIEKAIAEVSFLKEAASSLQSELEKEKEELIVMKGRRSMSKVSVESLEAELSMIRSEAAAAELRKKETTEKSVDILTKLQQAVEEANQAKSHRQRVYEELQRARNEAEQADAAINRLQETETAQITDEADTANMVTISLEEYQALNKYAQEAEGQANMRIAAAFIQMEEAKNSEVKSLQKLKELGQELSAKKQAFTAATKKTERAMSDTLSLEQELIDRRTKNAQTRQPSNSVFVNTQPVTTHPTLSPRCIKHRKDARKSGKVVATEPLYNASSQKFVHVDQSSLEYDSLQDLKIVTRKKRSLFPRLFMFFLKKKPYELKKIL